MRRALAFIPSGAAALSGTVHGSARLSTLLLASGLLASAIYATADMVTSLAAPGYSMAHQAISELSAQGAPTVPMWSRFMMFFGLFFLLFVAGMFRVSKGNRALRVDAYVMLAFGVLSPVLWSLVPMHQRGAPFGWQDAGHIAMGAISVLTITTFIVIGAFALGAVFRRYSLVTAGVVLLAGAASFLYVPRMIAQEPTPWLGVIERVSLYGFYLWMAVLAVALVRRYRAGAAWASGAGAMVKMPAPTQLAWTGDDTARHTSIALAVVAVLAGAATFFFWPLFTRDAPMVVGNARGTALTVLVLAVPLLVGSMILSRRGSVRAVFVWTAALGYLGYNAVLFSFSLRFNPFFLPFAAMLSLSFWAIVVRLRTLDLDAVADASARVPVGVISVYLLLCVVAWGALWLSSILPATLSNTMPRELAESGMGQNAVWVLDFAFTFPLAVVGALWIWRRRPWGYVVAGTMTLMLTLETAGVFVDQLFGRLHDPSASLGALPPLAAFTVAGAVVSAVFLARLRSRPPSPLGA